MKKKLIITDYGFLPDNLNESSVYKTNLDYLIYDRKHRLNQSKFKNIKYQKNLGQNIYDIFDYIVDNYDNLEDILIFCKGSVMFPKNRNKPLPNGHCSEEKFFKLIKESKLTEIHDYENSVKQSKSAFIDYDGSYNEINNSWYLRKHKPKYFISFNLFMEYMFEDYKVEKYNRFSPGGNYIVPKNNILFYDKFFYIKLKKFVSWGAIVGDAHTIERALFLIFSNKYKQKKYFSKNKLIFNKFLSFVIYHIIYLPLEIVIKIIKIILKSSFKKKKFKANSKL